MKTFKLQNLLRREGNTISGAMSPVLFAQEMANQLDFKIGGLVRVWFDDERVHNRYEGSKRSDLYLTGFDTLLVKDRNSVMMMIDMGVGGCPVALYFPDDKDLTVTPIYKKKRFEQKLTEQEIVEVMEQALKENAFEIEKKNNSEKFS
jgi:hypothetical protein